jgi:transcriptional regulator GlxA family with amidase domain
LRSEAIAAAARGEYRQALRLLYLSCLLSLDEAGVLDYHPAVTNWSYVAAIRRHVPFAEPFATLTALVDRALYAVKPVSAQDFDRGQELLRHIQGEML